MTRTAIFGIVGVTVVGTAIGLAAGKSYESKETQRAKQELEARQAQAEEAQKALEAKTRQRQEEMEARAKADRERLEAQAKAKQEQIASSTEQQVDALQDRTQEQQAQLEQQTREQQARIQAGVDQAKARVADAERSEMSGTVASINPEAKTLAIREDAGGIAAASQFILPTQVKLGEGTAVLHAGQRLSLRDVQVGDKVRLQLQGDASQRTVQTIVINQRMAPAS